MCGCAQAERMDMVDRICIEPGVLGQQVLQFSWSGSDRHL